VPPQLKQRTDPDDVQNVQGCHCEVPDTVVGFSHCPRLPWHVGHDEVPLPPQEGHGRVCES
jgi:hypothetical protein